jgi:hypothetical protein
MRTAAGRELVGVEDRLAGREFGDFTLFPASALKGAAIP